MWLSDVEIGQKKVWCVGRREAKLKIKATVIVFEVFSNCQKIIACVKKKTKSNQRLDKLAW